MLVSMLMLSFRQRQYARLALALQLVRDKMADDDADQNHREEGKVSWTFNRWNGHG